jgi:hypothetical protein
MASRVAFWAVYVPGREGYIGGFETFSAAHAEAVLMKLADSGEAYVLKAIERVVVTPKVTSEQLTQEAL